MTHGIFCQERKGVIVEQSARVVPVWEGIKKHRRASKNVVQTQRRYIDGVFDRYVAIICRRQQHILGGSIKGKINERMADNAH